MTTMRLPALTQQNRGLADLTQSMTRDRRPDLALRSDRATFGDSLREAAQERSRRLSESGKTEQADSEPETDEPDSSDQPADDVTEQSSTTEAILVDPAVAPSAGQPGDSSEADEQASVIPASRPSVERTPELIISQTDKNTQQLPSDERRIAADPRLESLVVPRGADSANAGQPSAPPISGEEVAATHIGGSTEDSVMLRPGDGRVTDASRIADPNGTSTERTAATPAQQQTATGGSSQHDERPARNATPNHTQHNTARLDPVTDQQAAPAKPADTSVRASEHIAAGIQREAERTAARPEDRQPRRHLALLRAHQVQGQLQVEQVTGTRPSVPVTASPVADAASLMGASTDGLSNLTTDGTPREARVLSNPVLDRVVTSRIVRGLSSMLQQRGGSMMMRLDPPELGQLRVQMSLARGVVNAQFMPATQQAQNLIERNIQTLRAALESQGLSVERLTVHSPGASSGQGSATTGQGDGQHGHGAQHDTDAGDAESRGREHADQRRNANPFSKMFTDSAFSVPEHSKETQS